MQKFTYTKTDGTTGEYVGTIEESHADRILVKLDGVFDTLKSGERKQTYRTLKLDRVLAVAEITGASAS